MSKPYGIDAMFSHVIFPTSAENAIWDAVAEAMAAGMTFDRVKREVAEAWQHAAKKLGEQAEER